jgi:CBS domain-containing protein
MPVLNTIPVSSVMVRDIKTVAMDATVRDVCKAMRDYKIGSVIIMSSDSSQPAGIVTERDIVHHMASKAIVFETPVSTVMSKPIITIRENGSLADAIQTMYRRGIRRLVVVDQSNKMIGIMTDKDIFRAIVNNQPLASSLLAESPSVASRDAIERMETSLLGDIIYRRAGVA